MSGHHPWPPPSPFAAALIDARLSMGEADRLERMVALGCDKLLAVKAIVAAREGRSLEQRFLDEQATEA